MRHLAASILLLILTAIGAAADSSPVTLKVVRTAPALNANLPRFGSLYVEVAYDANQPLRLQARGYAGGSPLDRGEAMNASIRHPAGSGRALVWVSYQQPVQIDEIRITAYDEGWKPLLVLRVAALAQWLEKPTAKRQAPPDWVAKLIEDERRIAAQTRTETDEGVAGIVATLVGMFMFTAVPGYFVIQAAALFQLRGTWRMAALAPLAVMVPALAHAFYAFAAGSNLWPLLVILAAPIGFLYLCGLYGLRFLGGHEAQAR